MARRVETSTAPAAPVKENQIKWINTGGRHYMTDGRVIERKETFFATPSQIPATLRDIIKPLDAIPTVQETVLPAKAGEYSLQRNTAGSFDIVDPQGKAINEKPLSEDNAKELLARLN